MPLLLASPSTARSQPHGNAPASPPTDLTEASLEALMNLEVTTATKHEQSLRETAGAIFVLTQEDLRRSGATTIAEALRLVPGVNVARIDAHRWAISARGFNWLYANKLLVLIDGRTVYNPFFSGVHWDVQDTALEDIDRIEVIRGPGATLWGANAVNGIVNVITKPAAASQGGRVSFTAGTEARAIGTVRYGGKIGSGTAAYRVFAKGLDIDDSIAADNRRPGVDGWRIGRAGFRFDVGDPSAHALTLQGDIYRGRVGDENDFPRFTRPLFTLLQEDQRVSGGNLLLNGSHRAVAGSRVSWRMYADRHSRDSTIRRTEHAETLDLEAQHEIRLFSRHGVVYGAGVRWIHLESRPSQDEWFQQNADSYALVNLFVQDEIDLLPNRVRVTVGTKIERVRATGANVQPSARVLWTPTARHTLWASVARAVRAPSHLDLYEGLDWATIQDPLGSGLLLRINRLGNPAFRNETMVAWEAGGRAQLTPRLSVDVAGYYQQYDNLQTIEQSIQPPRFTPVPHVPIFARYANLAHGDTHGLEAFATFSILPRWVIRGGYTWYTGQLEGRPGSTSPVPDLLAHTQPTHQVHAQSLLTLRHDLELDVTAYGVGKVSQFVPGVFDLRVPAYGRLDARVAWRVRPPLELSLVGQNLSDAEHQEFPGVLTGMTSTLVRRSAYVKATWTF